MELNAATLSIKHDQVLRQELRLNQVASYFWTDSIIVLRYIRNESRTFKTFVANRVALIRGNSDVSQWRFVTGSVNLADMITRGVTASELLKYSIWLRGPQFLTNSMPWPKQPDFLESKLDYDLEIRSVKVCLVKTPADITVDHLFSSFSNWNKLKITVGWLLRYRHNLQRHKTERAKHKSIEPLSVEELQEAELQILKYLQRKHYIDELQELIYGKPLKRNNKLANLDPFIDVNGVIRVGGRLALAPIAFGSKHQILVPRASAVASLLISHFHCVSGHAGQNYVLSAVRGKFWIPKANSLIRTILGKCVTCRKIHAPLGAQKMADLPPDPVTPGMPPFSFVGVDYFGPFLVKRGRSTIKRYGVIFTCLVLRAIHIEVAYSLDTSSFIQVSRRFIARRGPVIEIRSDNAANFVGAEKELKLSIDKWNQNVINKFLLQKQIKWVFQHSCRFASRWCMAAMHQIGS